MSFLCESHGNIFINLYQVYLLVLTSSSITFLAIFQDKKSQYERNAKLLETLRLRGGDSYQKFRHVLYLTGHQLLADHLYGEGM